MLRVCKFLIFTLVIFQGFVFSAFVSAKNNNENNTQNSAKFSEITQRDDEDLLIATFQYKNIKLTDGLLIYTNTKGEALIPFSQFVKLMNLPITFNMAEGIVEGTFLKKGSFWMNAPQGMMKVNKQKVRLIEEDFERHLDEIYVTPDFLMVVFPIEVKFNMRELLVKVESEEMFPIDVEMESERQRKTLERKNNKHVEVEYVENSHLFSPPFIDISINSFRQENKQTGDVQKNSAYSIASRERVLGLDTELSVFDASNAVARQVRLRMGREFDENKLKVVRNFSIGDVISQSFPVVATNTMGRGMSFSTAKMNGISDDKTVTIDGPIAIGWDVELYRNGQLMNFSSETTTGRYVFDKIPLMAGNNDFMLKFYGPNGQRREEVRKFYMPVGNIVNKGEFNVKFSAVQENRFIIEEQAFLQNVNTQNNQVDIIAVVNYGITDNIVASVGASHINNARTAFILGKNVSDVDQNFVLAGLKATAFGIALEYNNIFTHDSQKSPAHYFSLQTATEKFRVNVVHEEYGEIKTMKSLYNNQFVKSSTNVSISNAIPLFKGFSVPLITNLSLYKSHNDEIAYNNTFQIFMPLLRIFNISGEYQNAREFNGNLNTFVNSRINMNWGRISIRGEGFYSLKPIKQLNNIRTTLELRATQKIMLATRWMRFYFQNSPVKHIDRYAVGSSLLTPIGALRLDAYHEQQTKTLGLMFNYSVGIAYNPASYLPTLQPNQFGNTGGIVADAYLDTNYNYKYDKGESILKDIPIKLPYSSPTNPNKRTGKVSKTHLPSYENLEVEVSNHDLAQKNMSLIAPKKIGARVRPSAFTTVHVPIHEVADVEGAVYIKNNSGKILPQKGITLYIVNSKGKVIRETTSDYDGIFVFDRIPFGFYKVTLNNKQISSLGYGIAKKSDDSIKLNNNNPIYYHGDIILTTKR